MNTLREPFMGLFWPFQGNNCLKFSPQKGQNRPNWVKMLFKLLKTQSKGVKGGQKGSTRLKRGQNSINVGPKAPKALQMGFKWAQRPSAGSKSVKMAFNWLKIGQNAPVPLQRQYYGGFQGHPDSAKLFWGSPCRPQYSKKEKKLHHSKGSVPKINFSRKKN